MELTTFAQRLEFAIRHCSLSSNFAENFQIVQCNLEAFQNELKPILSPSVTTETASRVKLSEYDLILMCFKKTYEMVSSNILQKKRTLISFQGDLRPYDLSYLQIFRFLFLDALAMRNMLSMRMEAQFNVLFRCLIEKARIIPLLAYDHEFAKEYAFNDSKLGETARYYKFLRPSKIMNRIRNNLDRLEKEAKESGRPLIQPETSFYAMLGRWQTTDDAHSLHSHFTHMNDMHFLLHYYREEDKFDLSIHHSTSPYSKFRYSDALEFLILLYNEIDTIHRARGFANTFESDLLFGYYEVIIKTQYVKPS